MDVNQVYLIDLQCLKALLNDAPRLLAVAIAQHGGQEDALPASFERLTDALFAEVILAVIVGRIHIGDTAIERARKRTDGLIVVVIFQESAAASERQDGDFRAGLAQHARRNRGLV